MSSRLRIGIIVAVVGVILIGLGTVAVVRLYRSSLEPPEEDVQEIEIATAIVVVANRDLLLGTLLTQEDLRTVEVPVEFTTTESIENVEDAVGNILKVDLVDGEMIMSHNLANPTDVTHDIAYVMSETHVLMAFPATDRLSSYSMVQRGDIVDLFATITSTIETIGENDEVESTTTSVTLDTFQRLNITAMVVDIVTEEGTTRAEAGEDEEAPRQNVRVLSYLLALDPQDALVIKFLLDTGANFDFVLRAPTSTGQFNLTPVTDEYIRELYGFELLP